MIDADAAAALAPAPACWSTPAPAPATAARPSRSTREPATSRAPATARRPSIVGADGRWLPAAAELAERFAARGARPGDRRSAPTADPGSPRPLLVLALEHAGCARPATAPRCTAGRGRSGAPTRAGPSPSAPSRDCGRPVPGNGAADRLRVRAMSARAAVVWTPQFLGLRPRRGPSAGPGPAGADHVAGPRARACWTASSCSCATRRRRRGDPADPRAGLPGGRPAGAAAGLGVGHGFGTAGQPGLRRMHEASALIAGGSLAAARAIADGPGRARGEHRRRAAPRDAPTTPSGFCVYNDAAVAISWLLDHGVERVAYVDVDVHHGDGVQAAFYDDPRVLTVSLHQNPLTLFPGTGCPARWAAGTPRAQRSTSRCRRAPRDAGWLRAFHAVVPSVLRAFRPQVLVTQCGADTHREDPLADLRLTVDGQREIYLVLRELAERAAGAAGWPSAAAGTRCSGWCRGRGRTCWPTVLGPGRRPARRRCRRLDWRARGRAAPGDRSCRSTMTDGRITGPGRGRGRTRADAWTGRSRRPGGRSSRCTASTRDDPRD